MIPEPNRTNLAYDLSRFDTAEIDERARKRREEYQQEQQARQLMLNSRSASKTGSLLKIVSVCVVFLAIFSAVNYQNVRVDSMARKITAQQEQLVNAQEENALLQSKLDAKVNTAYVEDYATNVLGMVKISQSQVDYLEVNTESLVEVSDTGTKGMYESLMNWLDDVKEYIGL